MDPIEQYIDCPECSCYALHHFVPIDPNDPDGIWGWVCQEH